MTISTEALLAASLAASGLQNNPFTAWDNYLVTASEITTPTPGATELTPGINAASPATYNFWSATPNGSGVVRMRVDLGAARAVTFAGIAAHNLADIDATLTLEYSTDDSTWNTAPAAAVTPADNRAIGFRLVAIIARYWRFAITGASGDAVIGVAFLGPEMMIGARIYQGYAPPITPTEVALVSNISEGGHFLGTSVTFQGSSVTAQLDNLSPATLRGAAWRGFQAAYNSGRPFFWAWRPTKYPGDLFYALRSGGALRPQNSRPPDFMSVELSMRLFDEP